MPQLTAFIEYLKRLNVFQWLIVITICYLLWQISLSGAILTAETMQQSDRLSNLAQKTVGFGVALFVFRVAWRKIRWLILVPAALLAGFLAMQMEDYLVNYFADKTTAQARLEAKKIQFFNNALPLKKVSLPQLPKDLAENPVTTRAFAKVLGFAIWNNPDLIAQINALLPAIAQAVYGQDAFAKIDAGYDQYARAWEASAQKLKDIEALLARLNFAQYARDLNSQLGVYAGCIDEQCRARITQKVNNYLRQQIKNIDLTLNLEDFCAIRKTGARFVMGRNVGEKTEKVCATTEKNLHQWMLQKIRAIKEAALAEQKDLPPAVRQRLSNDGFLSLSQWRELWQAEIDQEAAAHVRKEFGNAEDYAPNGNLAAQGRAFAISIFLPPVALGFSVTVCFLHLTSLLTAATHKPVICGAAAFICWILPAFFAASTPLTGFAGVYARWLVFWEGILYPFGIFRWLIL